MSDAIFLDPKRIKIFDPLKSNAAQIEYCKIKDVPHFAPTGKCWNCKRNIYSDGGIDLEEASRILVTGCPFCHRSYCD